MRRSSILILATLCVAPVLGQPRWERIGGAKGATFEIDRASVIKTGDQAVEAWFRSSLPKPMTLKDGRTYQSVATLYRIECEALRTGLAKVVMYAGPSFAQYVGSSSGEVTMERSSLAVLVQPCSMLHARLREIERQRCLAWAKRKKAPISWTLRRFKVRARRPRAAG